MLTKDFLKCQENLASFLGTVRSDCIHLWIAKEQYLYLFRKQSPTPSQVIVVQLGHIIQILHPHPQPQHPYNYQHTIAMAVH